MGLWFNKLNSLPLMKRLQYAVSNKRLGVRKHGEQDGYTQQINESAEKVDGLQGRVGTIASLYRDGSDHRPCRCDAATAS